jgi:hypothetical protein
MPSSFATVLRPRVYEGRWDAPDSLNNGRSLYGLKARSKVRASQSSKGVDGRAWIRGSKPGWRGKECGLSEGGGAVAAASGKEERKSKWPVWPALSLEHVAADEAKLKRGEKETPHERPWSASLALQRAWCFSIYEAQVSSLRQNKLSTE